LGRGIVEETPRKLIFLKIHGWYEPIKCKDCVHFNFIPLTEGAVVFCKKIEDDESCIGRERESMIKKEMNVISPLMEFNEIPQIEML
jgi:hypothetical protein